MPVKAATQLVVPSCKISCLWWADAPIIQGYKRTIKHKTSELWCSTSLSSYKCLPGFKEKQEKIRVGWEGKSASFLEGDWWISQNCLAGLLWCNANEVLQVTYMGQVNGAMLCNLWIPLCWKTYTTVCTYNRYCGGFVCLVFFFLSY